MQYTFGSGILWGTPLKDAFGSDITVPSPVIFGSLQDASVDISFETKTLHGQSQFPVAVGRGKGKVTGKAKFAQINGQIFNALFFGQHLKNEREAVHYDTVGQSVPDTARIELRLQTGKSFLRNLGVLNHEGKTMTRIASGSCGTNQYIVDDLGNYTFSTTAVAQKVFISYSFSVVELDAKASTVFNMPMGYAPAFRADLFMPFQGKQFIVSLPNCIGSKLGFSAKNDDFAVPEFDFEAFANDAGEVLAWSTSE